MQERVRRPALSFYTRLDRLGPGRSSVDLAGPPSNDLSAGAGAREPARRRGDGEGDRRRQTVPEIVGNPTSAVADMSAGKATTTPIAPQTMQPQTKRLFSGLRAQRQSRLGAARNQPQSLPSRAQGYEEGRTSTAEAVFEARLLRLQLRDLRKPNNSVDHTSRSRHPGELLPELLPI